MLGLLKPALRVKNNELFKQIVARVKKKNHLLYIIDNKLSKRNAN